MSTLAVIRHLPAILTAEKSFRRNPAIGSPALNARGLHRRRVQFANAMATRRRAAIAPGVRPEERAAFDRDGIVVRENALPQDLFERLVTELSNDPRPAWEFQQGRAVDRTFPLPPKPDGTAISELPAFARRPDVNSLIAYAAGRTGHMLQIMQSVRVLADEAEADPQSNFHADTFHANAKFWLFLHDVEDEDGPFAYVPGSHVLTPQRLAWEDDHARHWTERGDKHHKAGSFRVHADELADLGYGAPRTFPVKANTLVVADTFGFHRRTPAQRQSMRTAFYGRSRRNPFMPWNGLDPLDLPHVRGRSYHWYLASQDRKAKRGKKADYQFVGPKLVMGAEANPPLTSGQ